MGIKEKFKEQQQEQYEQQQTSETLISLLDRLEGIENNQRQIVTSFSSVAHNLISTWEGVEQTQRLMQQLNNSNVSENDSHAKTLTTIATTMSEMLELLASSKAVQLPDGMTVRAADMSAHVLMQKVSAQIKALGTTNLKLADAVHRQRAVNIDHEKLSKYLIPGLGEQLREHERSVQDALAGASVPMLAELERSRTELNEAGKQVSEHVRRAGEQVDRLRGAVTWRTVGQISAALLPLAIALSMVFGTAQTVWAAFGLQPILHTLWVWFLGADEWYWKLAIAGIALAVLTGFGWLTRFLGRWLHAWYRRY